MSGIRRAPTRSGRIEKREEMKDRLEMIVLAIALLGGFIAILVWAGILP